jgi:hypothetical protein
MGAEVLELEYQGHFQATRSARNPATILQSDLLGFATPVTMEILVTGPRHAPAAGDRTYTPCPGSGER